MYFIISIVKKENKSLMHFFMKELAEIKIIK